MKVAFISFTVVNAHWKGNVGENMISLCKVAFKQTNKNYFVKKCSANFIETFKNLYKDEFFIFI